MTRWDDFNVLVKRIYLAWKFTCNNTLVTTYVPMTSVEAGRLADRHEEMKLKRYEDLASSHIVMPVAIETLGSWGQMGLSFIKELGLRVTAVTKENRATSFLFQVLSLAVQRGNATSVMNTVPNIREFEELFLLDGSTYPSSSSLSSSSS